MYLGAIVTSKCEEDKQLDTRLSKTKQMCWDNEPSTTSETATQNVKFKIYMTIFRLIVLN